MRKRTIIIAASVTCALVVAAGLGVLIWWLVTRDDGVEDLYTVIKLEGDGVGDIKSTAAFTRIRDVGDVFWWFYPTVANSTLSMPIVLWLDGVTGVPPSLLANLGMIGPYDTNFNERSDSWINNYNLLFVDAPVGTGFSTPLDNSKIPTNVDENVAHLLIVLESFYSVHEEYRDSPLYVLGQADGAQSAVALAIKLNELKQAPSETDTESESEPINIEGVIIGNGIISPAVAMTKLGFYLEELGYIDGKGRTAVENLSEQTNALVNSGSLEAAFNNFFTLDTFVNGDGGAVAVNLRNIVEKVTREPSESRAYFNRESYIRSVFGVEGVNLMNNRVAPALGISSDVVYDAHRADVAQAVRGTYMTPFTDKIEHILQNTNLTVSIYNGNLDAITNTPGQLEWVNNLRWAGQSAFSNTLRRTLIVNSYVEGYFRETERLKFYWINAAGQSTPLDNPAAMYRITTRMMPIPSI
ncbi:retinoid-inducible serine carboxypeptidase-like [Anticarsia gemmatalis]|uniref:retinoid-inducible serine carboxypeptidase-like n=1 Tax=Anticarsia gemmatalis TaxID=129554 RepID=UPI003F75FC21